MYQMLLLCVGFQFLLYLALLNVCAHYVSAQITMKVEDEGHVGGEIITEEDFLEEARRQKAIRDRKRAGEIAAKNILHASASESCDWKRQPLSVLRGELCGSYYKVLDLDRHDEFLDKPNIKKAYRKSSLSVHPDKNPVEEAEPAFNIVQEAYSCLSDDSCKTEYDEKLVRAEEKIYWDRKRLKDYVVDKMTRTILRGHQYISMASHQLFSTGVDIWNLAGEWNVNFMNERIPLGRALLLIGLAWKGQLLLKLQFASYLILKINSEVARARNNYL
jgi:hypothetical protein